MHIFYQMTCISWLISTTLSNPERRYTTDNIIKYTHNVSTTTQNTIVVKKGSHKGGEKRSTSSEDDDKKTLAQQVADGKYGLIQKEIFSKRTKRPGILSYEINPEVPKDNINNFGGLEPDEIWLAENHLLVLKGGNFVDKNRPSNDAWRPIDNYIAPKRQVKIPPNPKVPPPFPIQLRDKGPIEFIQPNNSGTSLSALFQNEIANQNNISTLQNNMRNSTRGGVFPFPPNLFFPPGSGFQTQLRNLTDLDEDDPRIYYPPPYDFVYTKDNLTTHVPPGPIVPGIILPPPPNFFAPLDLKQNRTSQKVKPLSRGRKPEHMRTIIFHPRNITSIRENLATLKIKSMSNEVNRTVENIVTNSSNKTKLPTTTELNNGWIPITGNLPINSEEIKTTQAPLVQGIKGHSLNYLAENIHMFRNTSTSYPLNNEKNNYFRVLNSNTNQYFPYRQINGGNYYSTTAIPFESFHPIILNVPNTVRNIPPVHSYPFALTKNNNIKEPYIFYRDQYIVQNNPTVETYQATRKPLEGFLQTKPKFHFETNPVPPTKLFQQTSISVPPNYSKEIPKELSYYDQQYKKLLSQPQAPLIYFNQNRDKETGYSYDLPIQIQNYRPHEIKMFNVPSIRHNKINQHHIPPTIKTPIYEYSFSAPGYGTAETPKVATTPKPNAFQHIITPLQRPQYTYLEYQTTPKNINSNRYDQTKSTPNPYPTSQPNFQSNNGYSNLHAMFQTENPFNTFFTHDVGLMDDITKKYFSSFGQKLNNVNINNPLTTPLPQSAQRNQKGPYNENIRGSLNNQENNNENIGKLQHETYQTQSKKPYDEQSNKFQLDDYKFSIPNSQQNKQPIKYPHIYSPLPHYEQYDYESEIVRPNHPLGSDINVNFKNPPPINPDAEFVDPHDPSLQQGHSGGNAYISYQLPGNGGHFYFLTPRSVKAENYHLANSGIQYPNHDGASRYEGSKQIIMPTARRKRPQQNK